jgi:secreted PhoX family phosphatase
MLGGAGAIRFAADSTVTGAYRILGGTSINCAGGPTPWGTWLSCEERALGHVWECDPLGVAAAIERPLLGTFAHEAAAVDPRTGIVYLTEDNALGRLYRFVPDLKGDLSAGHLEAMTPPVEGVGPGWRTVPSTAPDRSPDTMVFARGEGAWWGRRTLFFCTTTDQKVWAYHPKKNELEVIYDGVALGAAAPLTGVDNVTLHAPSGDIFVAEDGGDMQLCIIGKVTIDGTRRRREVAPFLQVVGHDSSEVAGPAFSPDGQRLYFSSQRGTDGLGVTFEVSGPFRTT